MCTQPVVYPQRRLIFSTTQVGWLPVPYYTQQSHRRVLTHETHSFIRLTTKAEQKINVKRKNKSRHQFQTTGEERTLSEKSSSSFKVVSIRFTSELIPP